MKIKSIKKDYKTTKSIIIYDKIFNADGAKMCTLHEVFNCQICYPRDLEPIPSYNSLMRSKTLIRDYALSNDFDLFITFTLNPKKVDSFNHQQSKKVMIQWLNYQRKLSPDLRYLIVPELHKSGRIHFHGLFGNYYGSLTDSKRVSNSGKKIYNLDGYKIGYTTATLIKDKYKTANYITKYLTKQLINIKGNKKRYWVSKNLQLPTKTFNINLKEITDTPLFNLSTYRSEYYTIYNIIK